MDPQLTYESFVAGKLAHHVSAGLTGDLTLPDRAFPFQRDLVTWALRRGRAAIFASTGLGKTMMQLSWAAEVCRHTGGRVLILAPLAVAQQTVAEAVLMGIDAVVAREGSGVGPSITVTNYDRLHKFAGIRFSGVVLDESSIIKHHDAKTFARLTERFRDVPYKLAATATPAPNDYTELGTHAEFLGVCSRTEMLSEFFCHDGGDTSVWRLKGHARGAFWAWVASWGALVRTPADLGYPDGDYALPPLVHHEHLIPVDQAEVFATGQLFVQEAGTLNERRLARRASLERRVAACAAVVADEPEEKWIVWCDLNDESDALADAIDGAIEVRGSLDIDEKEALLAKFSRGEARAIVTKPSMAGFGLNWQHCARMAFVGVTDSFEKYFQAVRRSWRFGQKRSVHVHVFASESEGAVVKNLERKAKDAEAMGASLSVETAAVVRAEVAGLRRTTNEYARPILEMPTWLMSHE
jgi:superfamily II DNA or RNA helicase